MTSMTKTGYISIWIGLEPVNENEDVDVLKDLCGVEYYDMDYNESNAPEGQMARTVEELIRPFSFSYSFIEPAVAAAKALGITQGYWAVSQCDYCYDPTKAVGPVAADPRFIGHFPYTMDELKNYYPFNAAPPDRA